MPEIEEIVNRLFAVLELIANEPGISVTDISRKLGINRTTANKTVEVLVRLGLARKRIGGMPRRAFIEPTEKGRCMLECIKLKSYK